MKLVQKKLHTDKFLFMLSRDAQQKEQTIIFQMNNNLKFDSRSRYLYYLFYCRRGARQALFLLVITTTSGLFSVFLSYYFLVVDVERQTSTYLSSYIELREKSDNLIEKNAKYYFLYLLKEVLSCKLCFSFKR